VFGPPPLLGASLIVRNEAGALPACLAALTAAAGLVGEIVVYDTGSTDDTVRLARQAGATVVCGQWQEDFGAARNRALAHGRSSWVLVVDADERVLADPQALHRLLASVPPRDGYTVQIGNVGSAEDGLGYSHHAPRLFRRGRARWQGRVHEQLVGPGGDLLPLGALSPQLLRLEHDGYADAEVVRGKAERNARLLRCTLDELIAGGDPAELPGLLVDLGRTLISTGALQEAVDVLESVRELAPGTRDWRQATDFLARVLLGAGEDRVVLVLSDQLEQAGADRRYCDWLRAQALAQLGDPVSALGLLRRVDQLVDPGGRDHDVGKVLEMRSLVAQLAGRTEEAVGCLIAAMAGHGRVGGRGDFLLRLWGGRPADELAGRLRASGSAYLAELRAELGRQPAPGPIVAALLG
jgi:tetratricopeptide (TPR) repeat protein